jgi:hypothetical protein
MLSGKLGKGGAMALQPHPLTSVMQLTITAAALCIAAAAISYVVRSAAEDRNARLVEIGVGVLRIDPKKDAQVAGARKWAIDLIDANAGGIKFSNEARAALLQEPLGVNYYPDSYDFYPIRPLSKKDKNSN